MRRSAHRVDATARKAKPMTPKFIVLVGLVASVAILIASIALYVKNRRRSARGLGLRPWHKLCVWIFVSIFVFEFTQVKSGLSASDSPLLESLFSTVQMFLLEKDIGLDAHTVHELLGDLAQLYITYNASLFLLAPLTTVSAALVLFSKYASLPLLWIQSHRREVFLFSNLTEDSFELATSVAAQDGGYVVAFADVDSCEDEELVLQAREARFLCLSQSIPTLLSWCSKRARLHVVLSSSDEVSNLHGTLKLTSIIVKRNALGQKITIHAASDSNGIDNFVDAASQMAADSKANVQIRRINKTADLVRHMLSSNPLFLPGLPTNDSSALYAQGNRRIVIIGHNNLCYEFLKGALWCGRAKGLTMSIELIDASAQTLSQQLAFDCPELHHLAGTEYDVGFYNIEPLSEQLARHLSKRALDITYVLVSLDDDLEGIRVAKRVREILEQERIDSPGTTPQPLVFVRVEDTLLAATLAKAQAPKGQSYGLTAVGSRESLLSYGNVFYPSLEMWARNLNRAYWGYFDLPEGQERTDLDAMASAAYEKLEYNRTSSMASAIFLKYDLYSFCQTIAWGECSALPPQDLPSAKDWQLPLDDPAFSKVIDAYNAYVQKGDCEWLQRLEHERWNAYVRTLGFRQASEDEYRAFYPRTKCDQDQLARLHICLVPYDELDQVDAMVERVEGKRKAKGFKEVDKAVIENLANIVRTKDA